MRSYIQNMQVPKSVVYAYILDDTKYLQEQVEHFLGLNEFEKFLLLQRKDIRVPAYLKTNFEFQAGLTKLSDEAV